jgi:sec-independent protein translocase protein TatC
VWFVVFSIISYRHVDPLLTWLAKPIGHFVYTDPTEALFVRLKLAFGMGGVAAFPVLLFHVYRFVSVALKDREKTFIFFIIPFAIVLFLIGAGLSVFVVSPIAAKVLLSFSSPELIPMISVQAYLSFLFWMIVGFGALFQVPLFVVILCRAGVIKPATLASYRKHVLVGIFIISAVLTPGPDVFSQMVLALPAYLLFEISLLLVRVWK